MTRVLVVDDEADVLSAVREALEDAGYEVVTATDGAIACAILEHGELPHLMVLDLMMPVMDGWALLRRMREDDRLRAIPVIVMSVAGPGAASIPDRARYVKKPVNLEGLLEAIRGGLASG